MVAARAVLGHTGAHLSRPCSSHELRPDRCKHAIAASVAARMLPRCSTNVPGARRGPLHGGRRRRPLAVRRADAGRCRSWEWRAGRDVGGVAAAGACRRPPRRWRCRCRCCSTS
jgi:hypothetical protein